MGLLAWATAILAPYMHNAEDGVVPWLSLRKRFVMVPGAEE